MPSVVRKDLDNTSAILTVKITGDELKPKLDSELKRIRQRATIKGFRPGQAPMNFVKRMYGTSIFVDLFNDMISKELFGYIKDNQIDILGQPLPTEDQEKFAFDAGNPEAEYLVNYEIGFAPTFDIKGLDKNESFERLTVSNLDELAEEDLNYARQRMGTNSNPTEDIRDNDIVKIASRELESAEGAPKEGGWETTITLLMKTVTDEAVKAELLTKKQGDTIRFNARNLENQTDEKRYRKLFLSLDDKDDREVGDWFEGTIEEVNRVENAELSEEFYKGYFGEGVTTQDEAMDKLKEGIVQFYDQRADALLMRDFRERLLAMNKIDLPDAFLRRWISASNEGALTMDLIEKDYPGFAENLRWSMISDKIKSDSGIEVTDEDLRAEYAGRVRQYFKMDLPEELLKTSVDRLMSDAKDLEKTRESIEADKVFRALRDQVTITDKAVTSEEFHKILESVTSRGE